MISSTSGSDDDDCYGPDDQGPPHAGPRYDDISMLSGNEYRLRSMARRYSGPFSTTKSMHSSTSAETSTLGFTD